MPELCQIKGCYKKIRTKQLCAGHYSNCRRTGFPLPGEREMHGFNGTPEYRAWNNMRRRCEDKKHGSYEDYGGRGIKVHPTWRKSFRAFFAEVGFKPSEKHSLDRINNDGNYEPGNVRWATATEQIHNRRLPKANKSGYLGIHHRKDNNKWVAQGTGVNSKIHVGSFDTIEDALQAQKEYFNKITKE